MNLEIPVATSSSAARANMVTVWLEATTCTEVGATTAQKIEALHPSHRVPGSLARPFVKQYSQLSFAPHDSYQVQRRDQTQTLAR
jgi:hypothetical protein